eukprot:3187481-Rhodomonas_salina.1
MEEGWSSGQQHWERWERELTKETASGTESGRAPGRNGVRLCLMGCMEVLLRYEKLLVNAISRRRS